MSQKFIRNSIVLALLFLLIFSTNVFASPLLPGWSEPLVNSTEIIGDRLEMTSPTTGTFHYRLLDKKGKDVTSELPVSDLSVDAKISTDGWNNGGERAAASLDPQTGTCTLTYNFSESDKYIKIYIAPRYSSGDSKTLVIGNSDAEDLKRVDEIHFLCDSLTQTGPKTATFKYKIINFIDDITQKIPASQIEAFSSVDSTITLDPSTGTGTITFNNTDTNQLIRTTLRDKVTGITAVLNTWGFDPVPNPVQTTTSLATSVNSTPDPVQSSTASAISRINFAGDLIKTGTDTATFQYKILDHHYSDITKTIPATNLDATALIGSSKADISLDPAAGIGTITYAFSDSNQQVLVNLIHKKGIGVSALLNLVSSESSDAADSTQEDLEIAQITFVPTDMLMFNSHAQLQYQILNQEGKDITRKIPASELNVSSSVNSMLTLKPSDRTLNITYNLYGSNKTILVSLENKGTGVKSALNIGNMPSDPESEEDINDNVVIKFNDPVLEKAIRALIYKPTANIYKGDVRNIPDLFIDKGCRDLSGIENLTGLVFLKINSDQIQDLSPLKEIPKLRNLDYSGSLNDLQSLKGLTNLKLLDLGSTKISNQDLSSLQKALPDCFIMH